MANERWAEYQEDHPKLFLQSLFETSVTQKHPLGTIRRLTDGREYIYFENAGTNLAVAKCIQGPAEEANHSNIAIANTANIGLRAVNVTLSDANVVANQYAEGFLHVQSNVAVGYMYKIKNHPAANANANLTVTFYDKIRGVNLANTCYATLTKHPCKDVIVTAATATQRIIGVPTGIVLANYFAWAAKKGPCCVLVAGTLVAGDMAYEAANGAVGPPTANVVPTQQYVGRVLQIGANAAYGIIDLDL